MNFRFDTCNYSNTLRIFARQGVQLDDIDLSSGNLEQSIGDLDDNYSITLRIFAQQGIRFDDLDSSSNDLEQNIDDLDYTSITLT